MIEDKIKTGYAYTIKSDGLVANDRHLIISTGSGGALQYIKQCREAGLPEEVIGDDVYINLDGKELPVKSVEWNDGSFYMELKELIYLSIGAASVCWENGDVPTGVFDEKRAKEIAEKLIIDIKNLILF